jgi:RNA polymerase sigma-70 factor (family 1)
LDTNTIIKFKEGKSKAFEKIFSAFSPALCAFANSYVHEKQLSEDFVQEVFINLWNYRTKIDDLLSLKSFLYTSVRNKCLNHLKHRKVEHKYQEITIKELESDAFYSDHVIEEETHRLIYNTINELPAGCKEILLLSMNGLTNPEIAEDLHISVNTVKTQKAIAYKYLRIKLKDIFTILGITFPL